MHAFISGTEQSITVYYLRYMIHGRRTRVCPSSIVHNSLKITFSNYYNLISEVLLIFSVFYHLLRTSYITHNSSSIIRLIPRNNHIRFNNNTLSITRVLHTQMAIKTRTWIFHQIIIMKNSFAFSSSLLR